MPIATFEGTQWWIETGVEPDRERPGYERNWALANHGSEVVEVFTGPESGHDAWDYVMHNMSDAEMEDHLKVAV